MYHKLCIQEIQVTEEDLRSGDADYAVEVGLRLVARASLSLYAAVSDRMTDTLTL